MSRVVISEPDHSFAPDDLVTENVNTDGSAFWFVGLAHDILSMILIEGAVIDAALSIQVDRMEGDIEVSRDHSLS